MRELSEALGGALPGFAVLFEKELVEARRSKRFLLFLLIMSAAVALVPVIGYFRMEHFGSGTRHNVSDDAMNTMLAAWTALVAYLGSLMVIASTVDAVARERSLGIAAWIITKPVSRLSYLLAKSAAHALVAIASIIVVPSVVAFTLMIALFSDVPLLQVYGAAVILCVEMVFLSFFTVSLGVPLKSVAPIAIVALAFWFIPTFVPSIESLRWTYRVLPSFLPVAAVGVAVDDPYEAFYLVPITALAVAAAFFVLSVVWFERQEL